MGRDVLLISFALVMVGIIFYFLYGHKNSDREYALLHLIARITDKEVEESSHMLEGELRNIIHSRDDVLLDRFDRIIHKAHVMDIEESMNVDEFFSLIAAKVSPFVELSKEEVRKKLFEREGESSTAITPFTAIPHLIIEGKGLFDLVLVRARKGIVFSDKSDAVKSIFVLCGSRDQRLFHLQALASIAQTILNPEFETRWMDAKSEEALRDIILLSERRRILED
jgi:mannitol/fructose-specific phosphotransferase system IIA component (Ntr-type)